MGSILQQLFHKYCAGYTCVAPCMIQVCMYVYMYMYVDACVQIRFQSFTAPLLLLGCFSRHITLFPPSLSEEDGDISSSPGFQSFEAEFKTWQHPGEKLDENSFVFSAAEVFRFLRDMALHISMTQSTSLLQVCLY